MFKVIWLLKGKPGVSRSAFRDWYETSHSVIAEKYFGHLLLEYRRNYPTEVSASKVEGRDDDIGVADPRWDYDCITEWVMPNEAAFNEIMGIFTDPVVGKIFDDDSKNFLSLDTVLIKCEPRGRSAGDVADVSKRDANVR